MENCDLHNFVTSNPQLAPSSNSCPKYESFTISNTFNTKPLSIIKEETLENSVCSESISLLMHEKVIDLTFSKEQALISLSFESSDKNDGISQECQDSDDSLGLLPDLLENFSSYNLFDMEKDTLNVNVAGCQNENVMPPFNIDELLVSSSSFIPNVRSFNNEVMILKGNEDSPLCFNTSIPVFASTPKHEVNYSFVIDEAISSAQNLSFGLQNSKEGIENEICQKEIALNSDSVSCIRHDLQGAINDENKNPGKSILNVTCDISNPLGTNQISLNKTFVNTSVNEKYSLPFVKNNNEVPEELQAAIDSDLCNLENVFPEDQNILNTTFNTIKSFGKNLFENVENKSSENIGTLINALNTTVSYPGEFEGDIVEKNEKQNLNATFEITDTPPESEKEIKILTPSKRYMNDQNKSMTKFQTVSKIGNNYSSGLRNDLSDFPDGSKNTYCKVNTRQNLRKSVSGLIPSSKESAEEKKAQAMRVSKGESESHCSDFYRRRNLRKSISLVPPPGNNLDFKNKCPEFDKKLKKNTGLICSKVTITGINKSVTGSICRSSNISEVQEDSRGNSLSVKGFVKRNPKSSLIKKVAKPHRYSFESMNECLKSKFPNINKRRSFSESKLTSSHLFNDTVKFNQETESVFETELENNNFLNRTINLEETKSISEVNLKDSHSLNETFNFDEVKPVSEVNVSNHSLNKTINYEEETNSVSETNRRNSNSLNKTVNFDEEEKSVSEINATSHFLKSDKTKSISKSKDTHLLNVTMNIKREKKLLPEANCRDYLNKSASFAELGKTVIKRPRSSMNFSNKCSSDLNVLPSLRYQKGVNDWSEVEKKVNNMTNHSNAASSVVSNKTYFKKPHVFNVVAVEEKKQKISRIPEKQVLLQKSYKNISCKVNNANTTKLQGQPAIKRCDNNKNSFPKPQSAVSHLNQKTNLNKFTSGRQATQSFKFSSQDTHTQSKKANKLECTFAKAVNLDNIPDLKNSNSESIERATSHIPLSRIPSISRCNRKEVTGVKSNLPVPRRNDSVKYNGKCQPLFKKKGLLELK